MVKSKPILTIGLPVYNGGAFLRRALDSILVQDFEKFVIFASDNASTDDTHKILQEYAKKDPRINFVRQNDNIGAVENFKEVSNEIKTPYFMWFAADDEMMPGFLSCCIDSLESDASFGMAFSGVVNIDSQGRVIREYPRIPSFTGKPSVGFVARYILSPEFFGKANLIYSIYRTPVVRKVLDSVGIPPEWGGDMAFVLAAILESGIFISPEVLFRKRYVQTGEIESIPIVVPVPKDFLSINCPLIHFDEYESALHRVADGTPYGWLVCFLMRLRRAKIEFFSERIQKYGIVYSWQRRSLISFFNDIYRSAKFTLMHVRGS